ncbi:MAG: LTA synthase family protein [Clostridia bacterium]|nr:LTA synthase family protein [Clostridia bacterium]
MKIRFGLSGLKTKLIKNLNILFLPLSAFYGEFLLFGFNEGNQIFSMPLLRIFFFSLALGFALALLLELIPNKKLCRGLAITAISFGTVYTCVEYCCKEFFKTYFSFTYMKEMAGGVVGEFFGNIISCIISGLPFILLSLLPLVLFIIFRKQIIPDEKRDLSVKITVLILLIIFQISGGMLSRFGSDKDFYTYSFSADAAIPKFGAFTSLRLETTYAIFGTPESPQIDLDDIVSDEDDSQKTDSEDIEPQYNTLDIDFAALDEGETDGTIKSMHNYFGSLTPSQKNEYSGYFKDKNLILITAEAFSSYVIDKELTPTLYKLANEGFVFNNYYQPDWTQSTTGGEFAVMTGIIPTWVNGKPAFAASIGKYMPVSLGHTMSKMGYKTLAYHNNTYTYYNRHLTHPNLGYDYKGIKGGLELSSTEWPCSDLEMINATADQYINDYVENGQKFHAYYMTVSGHANYKWGSNAMSRRHREVIEAYMPDAPEQVQAYIACNLDLEYALSSLVKKLEEAGIADDTVIVMGQDHYPYGLVESDVDYYNILSGINDKDGDTSRYKNTLIIWSGSMKEPVIVDTPCSAIDIVPTINNLFDIPYDSRLYSGRDIFAENYSADKVSTSMPLVVFANYSWITEAGRYEASTKTFIPNENVTVDDKYINAVHKLVRAKFSYAKNIIGYDYYRKVLE